MPWIEAGSRKKRKTNRITARDRLAYRIRVEHAAARQGLREPLTHAMRAGNLLLKAKAEFAHGYFMTWVREQCQFSHATANLYMLIAREWPRLEANSERITNLSLGAVGEWLRRPPDGHVPVPHSWHRKYRALDARLLRAGQMLSTLLPAMNRLEAEAMREAFLALRRRVEKAIGELDRQIAGEIDEADRARAAMVAKWMAEWAAADGEFAVTPTEDTEVASGIAVRANAVVASQGTCQSSMDDGDSSPRS